MSDIKIILCTTFRDFKGNENDEIQRMFLKSIEEQTYNNFEIVVTTFGEKNVKSELKKFNFISYFYEDFVDKNYRYSLTKVILNAIKHAEERYDKYILLWTTSDVIYEKNFFETMIKNYNKRIIGTSHPHIIFPTVNDFKQNSNRRETKLYSGFDLVYFDREFLRNNEVITSLSRYIYYDWGVFEHFLIALNELVKNKSMINIYEESKVYKIENYREPTNESKEFFSRSHNLNSIVFKNFLRNYNITDEYFDLTYCHLKFSLSQKKFKHYVTFSKDILDYSKRKVRKVLSNIVPTKIKNLLKKRGG